jgi:3-hydroxybutyryl-CoA dehydratase
MNTHRLYFEDLRVGMQAQFSKTVTEADIGLLAGITGDFNPLHIDAEAAAQTRFHGRIVPGVLIAGLIAAVLGRHLPGPGCIYVSQQLSFKKPVRPGDTVHASVTVRDLLVEKALVVLDTQAQVQAQTVAVGSSTLIAQRRPAPDTAVPTHETGP